MTSGDPEGGRLDDHQGVDRLRAHCRREQRADGSVGKADQLSSWPEQLGDVPGVDVEVHGRSLLTSAVATTIRQDEPVLAGQRQLLSPGIIAPTAGAVDKHSGGTVSENQALEQRSGPRREPLLSIKLGHGKPSPLADFLPGLKGIGIAIHTRRPGDSVGWEGSDPSKPEWAPLVEGDGWVNWSGLATLLANIENAFVPRVDGVLSRRCLA
jgi:hypothetical protein